MSFEAVDHAEHHPGACIFSGASRDLIDTKWNKQHFSGRIYIDRENALNLGVAAGLPSVQAFEAVEEQLAVANATIEGLEAELRNAKELLAEAESLRIAVAYTLQHGVVTDAKKLTVGLRHMPGQKRIDLTKPLYPEEVPA